MEAAIAGLIHALIASGLPGVFVVGLTVALFWLYRTKNAEIAVERQRLDEAHDENIATLRTTQELSESVRAQMAATDQTIKSLLDAFRAGGRQ